MLLVAVPLLVSACAPPIGVRHLTPVDANRALTVNILSAAKPSVYSARLLQRLALANAFEEDPAAVLAQLHTGLGGYDEQERVLALSELSFAYAEKSGRRPYFLAAAVYAWMYLTGTHTEPAPTAFDERVRLAADLYGRGIVLGLMDVKGERIDLAARSVELPFGVLHLETRPADYARAGYHLEAFTSLTELEVYGLRNRYRRRGIGAPLVAKIRPEPGLAATKWVPEAAKLPVTLIVRFDGAREALAGGQLTGRIELYDPVNTESVNIDTQTVPLETDPTAELAYRLHGSPVWDFELAGFRRGDFTATALGKQRGGDTGLYMFEPYQPGRIPLVFVHGTASSPARWAEMGNELMSDPWIASRYQFWFFLYNTGNPVAYSAMHLRDDLQAVVRDVDPEGNDSALRNMVLIGHSQGGLLVKMTVVDSGTRFWDAVANKPFDQVMLLGSDRDLLHHALFVEPLPFVKRVIFVATPHHGSFVAENWMGNLARRLVTFPATLVHVGTQLVTLNAQGVLRESMRVPTAVENMRASNPFLRTLSTLPIDPHVHVHSIIAVKGDGPPEQGDDGVVRYSSAHIEPVDSEIVVRSPHSVQSHPEAIEEVRRILREHCGPE
jgi:pimeloyl-ACP methyl ester carboxylesterase